ncbi:DEAD/DEAH box helicase [Stenotrophomonas ginsengisoli]|uniref:RNA helicase n=1 Tax=Stenotrophomonas ginsengisoli TaxID=336566 RepID=A0A0R0DAW7_9GAMM|nr:ATP-dependent RNA helicase HrpA [Stenotrophomonas ginsengisoli]KRG79407.1 DEAD/DEAH box helicase [Stenotrophomonas ginsengisoli]
MSAIEKEGSARLRARRAAIDSAMSRDRGRLLGLWSRWNAQPGKPELEQAFEKALTASMAHCAQRQASAPAISLDTALPIAREGERIIELIRNHQVVVIAGETGSGKTTQLPKLCLAAGRGSAGMIGCTQPRRIAARAVATRVAQELNTELGSVVGYQVRFTDKVSDASRIKFMTDGILLAEIASDRWLSRYDTIIVDEAHERSLNIDFLLGYLKTLLKKRPDLKLIVTSATIDTGRFAAHFDDAPVVSVEGRTFPVDVRYRPLEGEGEHAGERTVGEGIVAAVDEITGQDGRGDILIFLPGEREIRETHQLLEKRKYRSTEVLPLYARLSVADQDRVFNPQGGRRIVLATNVAETSLTVPRIRYVIDPGQARIKRYSPRQKLDRLHIEDISQASANQRKGRCGRVAEGVCVRLYAEADFQARPEFTDPEIRRSSLAGVILRMLQLGLGKIEDFPFLEAPDERAIADGWQQLVELGAVDEQRRMTAIGKQMARLPVDVKLARMLVAAHQHDCLAPMITIAAFLGIQDPRERPPEAREAADNAHAQFADGRSEFVGILRLWDGYRQAHEELTQGKLRDWCGRNFLAFLRMREWRELHRQLRLLCAELGWEADAGQAAQVALLAAPAKLPAAGNDGQVAIKARRGEQHRANRLAREGKAAPAAATAAAPLKTTAAPAQAAARDAVPDKVIAAAYQALHRALIAGLPTQVGHRTEKGDYQAPRQRRFTLFPGSALAKRPPPWVLTATLLDTQKVWGLSNAAIEPDWVIEEIPHLLARKHFDPHWARARGQVVASEQISLFGLVLAPKKPVNYGPIDPPGAHDIFVRQALVPGEISSRAGFVADNLKTLEKAREEEAKLRRAGIVADEQWQARWYLDRVAGQIHSAAQLDSWWKGLDADKRRGLYWSQADLLPGEGSQADLYPKYLALGDARLPLHYRFEPGSEDDGVTLEVPLHLLGALDAARLTWLAPGFVAEKAAALIRSLPKAMRRNYVPAPDFARAFFEAWPQPSADAISGELARFLSKATGASVAATDFEADSIEQHLQMNHRLRDEQGRVLAQGRDLEALRARFGERAGQAFAVRAGRALAAEGLTVFPATPIPVQVPGEAGVPAFPALVDTGDSAALRIFADRSEAALEHPRGVRRLLEIGLADKIKQARKQLPVSPKTGLLYAAIETQERLRGDLVDAALNAVLAEGLEAIRDADSFQLRLAQAGKTLFGEAMSRLQLAETILGLAGQIKPQLESPLMGWAKGNLDDLRGQLAGLIHPGFLRETPADALAQFPRYLKGMLVRAERAKRDPAKDQARMLELTPFADALHAARLAGRAGDAQWQALRWDLEELRIQTFAQELGVRGTVSAKKLAQRVAALQR